MGMDGVDLVVRIEQEFAIALGDDEASRVLTVGDLCALVLASTAGRLTRAQVEDAVRRVVSEQLGVSFERTTLGTRFVEDLGLD